MIQIRAVNNSFGQIFSLDPFLENDKFSTMRSIACSLIFLSLWPPASIWFHWKVYMKEVGRAGTARLARDGLGGRVVSLN